MKIYAFLQSRHPRHARSTSRGDVRPYARECQCALRQRTRRGCLCAVSIVCLVCAGVPSADAAGESGSGSFGDTFSCGSGLFGDFTDVTSADALGESGSETFWDVGENSSAVFSCGSGLFGDFTDVPSADAAGESGSGSFGDTFSCGSGLFGDFTELSRDLSSFSLINRVVDDTDTEAAHTHYEDINGQTVSLPQAETESTSLLSETKSREVSGNLSAKSAPGAKKSTVLPGAYDLRQDNAVSAVKNQEQGNVCWALSTVTAIESSILKAGYAKKNALDLSENHLIWYTYHPAENTADPLCGEGVSFAQTDKKKADTSAYTIGGDPLLTTFALARWSGVADESRVTGYSASSSSDIQTMAENMQALGDDCQYTADYKLTDAVCLDSAGAEAIKQAIRENGALSVSYYRSSKYENTTKSGGTAYYQTVYTEPETDANHMAVIIGWDDDYPKENFSPYTPQSDGAWLVQNSYGSDYGDDGCVWISYEEPSLYQFYSYSVTTSDTFNVNYQYDAGGYFSALTADFDVSGANIFTANANADQEITAVSFYTLADGQDYTVCLYTDVTKDNPTSGTLAACFSGTESYAGYHTVTLPKAVTAAAGSRFSVVITYKTVDGTAYFPVEGSGVNDYWKITYTSSPGQSYLYNGTLQEGGNDWAELDENNYAGLGVLNNLPIKAFATENLSSKKTDGKKDSAALNLDKVTLGKKETVKLKASVPTGETVSYKSSDPDVAKVNAKGKITAKKKGKAVITATFSGGASAMCRVTVKKAPKKVTAKPAKKTLAVGQSFTIKTKLPAGSASETITYTSAKKKVAKVNAKGKVTAKKKGRTVITVRTYNNKEAKVTVVVR